MKISFKQLQIICVHHFINCDYPLKHQVTLCNSKPCKQSICPVWARWLKHNEQNRKGNTRRSKLRRADKLHEAQVERYKNDINR